MLAHRLSKDSEFQKHLAMVVVDDADLIVQWYKQIRHEYIMLQYICGLIPERVQWLACTTTIDQEPLEIINKSIGGHCVG